MRSTTPGAELAALCQALGQAHADHHAGAIVEAYAPDAALALTGAALGYAPRPCLPTPADDLQPARTRHRLATFAGWCAAAAPLDNLEGEAIMATTNTHTIQLHRVLRATPERIYRAFLDADALVKWLPPHGFTGKMHHMDARVGGTYKMSFTNFTSGKSHTFGGTYLELVPHARLRYTDQFDDPTLPGEMQTTITLQQVSVGTEVRIVQEGVPSVIPAEACYLGWQASLTLLAQLVETEIAE
jgi:uncharacterized protein YndB with AHSA1/START domain